MKRIFKTLLFSTLNTDAPLLALLGAGQRIFRQFPREGAGIKVYPSVYYEIVTEIPNDSNCDQHCNCSKDFTVNVHIFSINDLTLQLDQITQRIEDILHEQYITDGTIESRWIYKKGSNTLPFNENDRTHHEVSNFNFRMTNV